MRLIDADALGLTDMEIIMCNGDYKEAMKMLIDKIEHALTIEERKTGRWIKMSDRDGIYWACSECGEDIPRITKFNPQFDLFPRMESINKTKYCPSCGAMMRSEKND